MSTYIADNGIEYGDVCIECGGDGVVAADSFGFMDEETLDAVECDGCAGTGYEGGMN
jgi:hypothetical protein